MYSKEERGVFVDGDHLMLELSRTYRNELYTNISFVLLDGVTMVTNKFMLACRSDYFATMLFGKLKEGTSGKVDLKCDSSIFRLILDYVWEGKVDFSQLSLRPLLDLMENARMMCLDRLVRGIEDYLKDILTCKEIDIEECLVMLEFCIGNQFEELGKHVLQFVDLNFGNVTCHEDFFQLSESSVMAILKYQARISPEIDVFNALVDWIGSQAPLSGYSKEEMLSLVNLILINRKDLLKIVRKTALYDDKAICDALEKQLEAENVNVCLEINGAKLVAGKPTYGDDSCLREPPLSYNGLSGYTYNELGQRITVELNTEYMINKIEFLLWDLDDRRYSYILQSSMDGINWSTVLDCRELDCKSTQTIFFEAKRMKFISVKGTRNTYTKDRQSHNFHIVSFLATLDTTTSQNKNGGMKLM